MKDSQAFVIKKLNQLFETIDGIEIRYEYRDYLFTHIIEILPFHVFDSNQEYILFEMEFENEFEKLFRNKEDILFISADSLNEIKDVQFSLKNEQ